MSRSRFGSKIIFCTGVCAIGAASSALAFSGSSTPPQAWVAPARYAKKSNPIAMDTGSIALGGKVFTAQCVACHGASGKGDGVAAAGLNPKPHNLSDINMWELSDGEIFYMIQQGRAPMPGFKKLITKDQAWQVVNYIRSLSKKPEAIGHRFEIGAKPTQSLTELIAAAQRVNSAMVQSDTESVNTATLGLIEAADAFGSFTLSGQDKSVAKLYAGLSKSLASSAHVLETVPNEQAFAIVMSRFSENLVRAISAFGGISDGQLYQFRAQLEGNPRSARTWVQSDAEPNNPFDGYSEDQISLVSVFGPHTK